MQPVSYSLKLAAVNQLAEFNVRIKYNRSKRHIAATGEAREGHCFGVPLDVLVERAGVVEEGLPIPRFLAQIAALIRRELHTEGLFRVCGNAARMRRAQAIVDGGGDVQGTVHDVAGLLKQFLREMPEPLLTHRLYPFFVRAQQLPSARIRSEAVLLLCLELPHTHLATLKYLMHLLHDIVHAPGSLMSAPNLAAIFTPNILRPEGEHHAAGTTGELELANHTACVAVTEHLIENYDKLGQAPMHVLRRSAECSDEEQARHEYRRIVRRARTWWRNPFASKAKPMSRLTSATTLDLLKRPLSPTVPSATGSAASLTHSLPAPAAATSPSTPSSARAAASVAGAAAAASAAAAAAGVPRSGSGGRTGSTSSGHGPSPLSHTASKGPTPTPTTSSGASSSPALPRTDSGSKSPRALAGVRAGSGAGSAASIALPRGSPRAGRHESEEESHVDTEPVSGFDSFMMY